VRLRSLVSLGFAALSYFLSSAFAADCQLQSSQPVQDFGQFNPYELTKVPGSDSASLGQRVLQLTVICPDPSTLAIVFRGAAAGAQRFKMGDAGQFSLTVKDALLDGQPVNLGRAMNPKATPEHAAASVQLTPEYYIVPLAISNSRPQQGKTLTLRVEINAYLKMDHLKIRDITPFQGQGFFELDAVPGQSHF